MKTGFKTLALLVALTGILFAGGVATDSLAADKVAKAGPKKPDFPKIEEVTKDFVKVVSTNDGSKPMGRCHGQRLGLSLKELVTHAAVTPTNGAGISAYSSSGPSTRSQQKPLQSPPNQRPKL